MDRSEKLFGYCERGLDPAFWAEPVNALTNIGFIVAALWAWRELAARPAGEAKAFRYFLVANVFVIGAGSFLFHTFATTLTAKADVTPIAVFMLAYLGFAFYHFLRMPIVAIIPAGLVFMLASEKAMQLQCWKGQVGFALPVPEFQETGCLNGSVAYMPALAVMLLVGGWLAARRHPASSYVLGAALIFMLSVTFRTVDRLWCDGVAMFGHSIGTHFLWHILNSVTLGVLLLAAVRHGAPQPDEANTW